MTNIKKNIFFAPKDKKLAAMISIRTPGQFNKSIEKLKKRGITVRENKALNKAKSRAKVQLKRKNLSIRERNQMRAIAMTPIPRVTR